MEESRDEGHGLSGSAASASTSSSSSTAPAAMTWGDDIRYKIMAFVGEAPMEATLAVKKKSKEIAIPSFYQAVLAYKAKHDGATKQHKKDTSDFLQRLMEGYIRRLNEINESEPKAIDTLTISDPAKQRQAMRYLYGMLVTVSDFLLTQRELKGLKKSELMKAVLQSLLYSFCGTTKEYKQVSFGKSDNTEAKQLDIDYIRAEFDKLLVGLKSSLELSAHDEYVDYHAGQLMSLPAEKEEEFGSRTSKRQMAYQVVLQYRLVSTPEDVVDLFAKIKEGIELSRAYGRDGMKSAQLEMRLRLFRDAALYSLVISNPRNLAFTDGHYGRILGHVSYAGETSPHAMALWDKKKAAFETRLASESVPASARSPELTQKLEQFHFLFYSIPSEVNGMPVDKAAYVLRMGKTWCDALKELIEKYKDDPVPQKQVFTYACLWNFYVNQCFRESPARASEIVAEQRKYNSELKKSELMVPPGIIKTEKVDKNDKDSFLKFSGDAAFNGSQVASQELCQGFLDEEGFSVSVTAASSSSIYSGGRTSPTNPDSEGASSSFTTTARPK